MTPQQTIDDFMDVMRIEQPGQPLQHRRIPVPVPADDEVLIRVSACGVCRTDLHILDGELAIHGLPLIPGHEIVGTVARTGAHAARWRNGQRIGVPWLASTCRTCAFCLSHQENLCNSATFTGYDRDGGYAQYALAKADYCVLLPARYDDLHVAPMLCAGLIGYRAYAMIRDGARRIGIYGFGAAAHIITQIACHRGQQVFAFTRSGDTRSQAFALSLGAAWAGDSATPAPEHLDAALLFAPAGLLVPAALAAVRKGGDVVCAGIHMSDIPSFPYSLLWGERCLRSVANLTRHDAEAFFRFVAEYPVYTSPVPFPLERANDALDALRRGDFDGAAVLLPWFDLSQAE